MVWDGVDRRRGNQEVGVEIAELRGDIKALNVRINGSLDKMATFMESGIWWRRAIIGVVFTIILQATGGLIVATRLAESYGQNHRQIDVNSGRLDVIESYIHNGGTK